MANVNDSNNTLQKLENQWENLRESDIDDRDRNAIREFVRLEREGNQGRKPNTLIRDLSTLRNASERADTPLVDMDMGDFRGLLATLTAPKSEGGYGLDPSKSGLAGYKQALRVFFRWLDTEPGYGDFEFWDNIDTKSRSPDRVSEDAMLTQEEIAALKKAANNPRDKALIEFLADTGARVSLAAQLRIGDVYDLGTDRPYYKPNPNGVGHKGAPDKRYPIIHSIADLRDYINRHHIDPRDQAPLWHTFRGYDRSNPQDGALSGDRIRALLKECKNRCSVEKPVNPHNFRHSAITRLSKTGHTPQQIKHIAAWASDRMLERYDHTTAQERNEELRAKAGIIDEPDIETEPAQPTNCGNCQTLVKADTRFCPNCGAAMTHAARDSSEQFDNDIIEAAAAADGELAEAVLTLRELIDHNPTIRRAILED